MKKGFLKKILMFSIMILITCSCSIQKDDLEGATIYTTVYPIKYITNYLYGSYSTINSIYPKDCDLNTFNLTDKQIEYYAKSDLFIYNGLTNEKETAKTLLNKNKDLLIIDVSYGLNVDNSSEELWLSPKNYLMLSKNIRDNLTNYLTSKYIIEEVNNNYSDFEEKISLIDVNLRSIASSAGEKNNIITSSNTLNFLNDYGFNVISLQDEENLKEIRLNNIKNKFKSNKYKYILCLDTDINNDIVTELVNNYNAKTIIVDSLTLSLDDDDYFNIMNEFIENIKSALS
ncbi:MAG: metal ABC transporter substrate-binding protein [Bacilli bacterium]